MGKLIDLTGKRFGRLTVIERAEDYVSPGGNPSIQWLCSCECGNTAIVLGSLLRKGESRSCGCLRRETSVDIHVKHGLTKSRLYNIWTLMKRRCLNPNAQHFRRYGGRGITICDEWLKDFMTFYNWAMANGYRDDLSIDRIDNNKSYCPENCRWATQSEQMSNYSKNRLFTIHGETKTLTEWCKQYNIKTHVVWKRIGRGWTTEEAFGIVPRERRKK